MTVTAENVQTVAGVPASYDVSIFLSSATTLVNDALADKGLSSDALEVILLYLAAHLTSLSYERGGLRRVKIGESDESYRVPGDKDIGFAATRFGQQAMMMDTTGTLAGMSANKGLKAFFEVL